MAIASCQLTDRVYRVTLSGLLTWAEFQAFLTQTEAENIFASGKVRVLIQLADFAGWEPGEQWGDIGFFLKHDQDIGVDQAVVSPAAISITAMAPWRSRPNCSGLDEAA